MFSLCHCTVPHSRCSLNPGRRFCLCPFASIDTDVLLDIVLSFYLYFLISTVGKKTEPRKRFYSLVADDAVGSFNKILTGNA